MQLYDAYVFVYKGYYSTTISKSEYCTFSSSETIMSNVMLKLNRFQHLEDVYKIEGNVVNCLKYTNLFNILSCKILNFSLSHNFRFPFVLSEYNEFHNENL